MNLSSRKFNKKKFKEAILYLINKYPNKSLKGKKKLAKLLYFVDFNFFEAYEEPITGATYRALPMGPVPDELDAILKEMDKSDIKVVSKKTGLENDLVVFSLVLQDKKLVFSSLTDKEKIVLDKVYQDYGSLSGKDLEIISHSEAPYNAVTRGEVIPYELSFYRGKSQRELVGK